MKTLLNFLSGLIGMYVFASAVFLIFGFLILPNFGVILKYSLASELFIQGIALLILNLVAFLFHKKSLIVWRALFIGVLIYFVFFDIIQPLYFFDRHFTPYGHIIIF